MPGSGLQLKSEPARRGRESLVSLGSGPRAGLVVPSLSQAWIPWCCCGKLPGTHGTNPGVPLGKDQLSLRIYPTHQGLKPFLAGAAITLHRACPTHAGDFAFLWAFSNFPSSSQLWQIPRAAITAWDIPECFRGQKQSGPINLRGIIALSHKSCLQ